MCPACIASTAVIVGSVTTTGGIGALLAQVFWPKKHKPAVPKKPNEEN